MQALIDARLAELAAEFTPKTALERMLVGELLRDLQTEVPPTKQCAGAGASVMPPPRRAVLLIPSCRVG
jgi:hypothetical protein